MELNKKQLELVESIYKTFDRSEFGQKLEMYRSEKMDEVAETSRQFYEKLKAICNTDTAFEYDTISRDILYSSDHDGFIKGFIYAMALTGKM